MRRLQQAIFLAVFSYSRPLRLWVVQLAENLPTTGRLEYFFMVVSALTRPEQRPHFLQVLLGVYPGKRSILNHTHFYAEAIGQRPELFK